MRLTILIFLFFAASTQAEAVIGIRDQLHPIKAEESYKSVKKKWKKIRWKQVFRPIKVRGKGILFWILLSFGIALFIRLFFFLGEWLGQGLQGNGFIVPVSLMLLSALIGTLLILAIPFIWIIRIIQEIQWINRYNKCYT